MSQLCRCTFTILSENKVILNLTFAQKVISVLKLKLRVSGVPDNLNLLNNCTIFGLPCRKKRVFAIMKTINNPKINILPQRYLFKKPKEIVLPPQ